MAAYPSSQLGMSQNTVNYNKTWGPNINQQPQVSYLNQKPQVSYYKPPAGQVQGVNNWTNTGSSGATGGNFTTNTPTGGDGGQSGVDLSGMRDSANDAAQRALQAALGVWETRRNNIMGKIPTVEAMYENKLKGLDLGLENFTNSANLEESKRVSGLESEGKQINRDYTQANRRTRSTASSLARQLRNMYSGLGTIDSSAYRDENIDQKTEIAQTLGDTNLELAGKLSANKKEQEDLKTWYSQQRLAEQQRVQLAKEAAVTEKNEEIRGILADAELSDAQKIQAVEEANARLQQRMEALDVKEMEMKQQEKVDSQNLALKMAELSNKGYSDSYKQTAAGNTAIKNAAAVIQQLIDQGKTPSAQDAAAIFSNFGADDETAQFYGSMYGGTGTGKQQEQFTSRSLYS